MAITLYHSRHARSMRCIWALEELGLDYELVTLKFPPRVHPQGLQGDQSTRHRAVPGPTATW